MTARQIDTPQIELLQGESFGALVPRKHYARALGVHPVTAARFEKTDPSFPPAIRRNGKAHATDVTLKRYRRDLISRGLA